MTQFTEHKVVPGSIRSGLPGSDAGAVDDSEMVDVTLHIRRRQALDALAITASRQFISRQQLESDYGAAPEDVQVVLDFARHFGLEILRADLGQRIVVLRGSAQSLSAAFKVQLLKREINGLIFRARTGPVLIPAKPALLIYVSMERGLS